MSPKQYLQFPPAILEYPQSSWVPAPNYRFARVRRSGGPTWRLQECFASRIEIFNSRGRKNCNVEFLRFVHYCWQMDQNWAVEVVSEKAVFFGRLVHPRCQFSPDVICGDNKSPNLRFPKKSRSTSKFHSSSIIQGRWSVAGASIVMA